MVNSPRMAADRKTCSASKRCCLLLVPARDGARCVSNRRYVRVSDAGLRASQEPGGESSARHHENQKRCHQGPPIGRANKAPTRRDSADRASTESDPVGRDRLPIEDVVNRVGVLAPEGLGIEWSLALPVSGRAGSSSRFVVA
jgi:hypothetical protein